MTFSKKMPGANRPREKAFADQLFDRLNLSPVDWTESERPDGLFSLCGRTIGMEITESTPHEKYWGADIARKIDDKQSSVPIVYSTTGLRNYGSQRTRDDLFHDMFNNPSYVSMEDERKRWCEDVRRAWANKRNKLNEDNYQRFDENWLLIWDNEGLSDGFSTLTNIQAEVLTTAFFNPQQIEFDHVYVLSGNYTFDFVPPNKVAFLHEKAEEMNEWIK